jgi:hypothetical protein
MDVELALVCGRPCLGSDAVKIHFQFGSSFSGSDD